MLLVDSYKLVGSGMSLDLVTFEWMSVNIYEFGNISVSCNYPFFNRKN